MIEKSEAVVLKTLNHGDTSKIITLYSRESGRLKLIAKGVRSPKSKAAGLFQPTRHLQVVYYAKPNSDLQMFKSGELVNGFFGLEDDFDRLTLAQVVVELLERSVEDEQSHPVLFELLVDTLKRLSDKNTAASGAYWFFHLQLLSELGFRPHVGHCSTCREPLVEEGFLGGHHPHPECIKCHESTRHTVRISGGVIQTIQYLLAEPWSTNERAVLTASERRNLWDFLWNYTFFHIESTRHMRSLKVLRQLYG